MFSLSSSLKSIILNFGLLLCFNSVNSIASDPSDWPIVDTPWSRIKGMYQKVGDYEIKAFLGIPYALPPVGILRFRRPISLLRPHEGIYHADHFRFACMQTPMDAVLHGGNATLSENCLFLNVWTPRAASPGKPYPVLLYAHGSGHVYGSTQASDSRGDILAGFGDIVVVTMGYRLGALGLAFDSSEDMPGNMAVHDIIQSLQWVRSNIQYFGGDPDQVTLSGMSAGASYATMIFTIPSLPFGLFNKLVLMSGVAMDPPNVNPPELMYNLTQQLAQSIGCPHIHESRNGLGFDARQMKCLMETKAETIVATQENVNFMGIYGDPFLLPDAPRNILKKGGLRRGYSILIGTEENEDIKGSGLAPKTKAQAKLDISTVLHERYMFSKNLDFGPLVDKYYADIDENDVDAIGRMFHAVISDAGYHCPSLLFAEKFAERNTVHLYRNEYVTKDRMNISSLGAIHSSDARLFLGAPIRNHEKYDDNDRAMSKVMMELLGSFVKGRPLPWSPVTFQKTGTDFYRWRIQPGASFEAVDLDPDKEICWEWAKYFKADF